MKNIFLILVCFIQTAAFSQNIQFPESFKYDPKIVPEMRIAVITDEAREHGIFKNQAVLTTEDEMRAVVNDFDLLNVKRVYIEFYEEIKKEQRDDAGIVVTEFNSKENLEDVLPLLTAQSNYVWLYVDKYLILVWNDGRESDERLRKSVDYYKKKLGTEEFLPKESHGVDMSETIEEATMTAVEEYSEPIAMVAPEGMFYHLGFGSVFADLFTEDELLNLDNYIQKFLNNYNTDIAIEGVGNKDYTEESAKGYAFHLVSSYNDKNRVPNNIVILSDEVQNKSYVYFGTENGKVLSKLPLEKLKSELNKKLKDGKIYKGLNKLLMEFEIALINESGQEAKIPGNYND